MTKSVHDFTCRKAFSGWPWLGLNSFSGVHDIVFLSALATAYQAVMRSSLRDTSNLDPKNIVVPDERLARYISEMLPGSKLTKLDAGIADETKRGGRPKIHENDAEKSRKSRQKEKEKRAELINEMFSCNRPQDAWVDRCVADTNSGMQGNGTSISIISSFVAEHQYFSTIYSHIKSTTPLGYLSCANLEEFVFAMEAFHAQTHDTKQSVKIFSPAIFDPNRQRPLPETPRNVV